MSAFDNIIYTEKCCIELYKIQSKNISFKARVWEVPGGFLCDFTVIETSSEEILRKFSGGFQDTLWLICFSDLYDVLFSGINESAIKGIPLSCVSSRKKNLYFVHLFVP